jgi:hypothetical protein
MEWISVKDRLPEESMSVLVWSLYWSGTPFIACIEQGLWRGERILHSPSNVTHWMPLPEPPKGAASND